MASEEPEDFSKLPLDVKLNHKVWRARLMGYEEATKLFRKIDDEASSEYSKYTGMVKKFVIDSNQMAQEKGVEAALAFVECAAAASKITGDVISGIVTKCLSARAKTKEGSILLCLMFVEIEQQTSVLEGLMEGFTNKQPKIVAGAVNAITRIVQEFGAKVLNVKALMAKLPGLFENSDKNVRAEAKTLAVELYKWVGAAIKPSLEKKLKPVQLKELEEEWGKISGAPTPSRRLRSQQAQAAVVVATGGGDGGDDGGCEGEAAVVMDVMDPYDLADPEDFMGKIPKDFFEKIVDPKWKERKEVLEAVLPLAMAIKLMPGDYGEVLKALKKVIIKDSNVLVVALAGKVVFGLAKGLRSNFHTYASHILSGIFEKFKEKKLNVVTALREASDAVYLTTSLANVQDEVVESLNSKNPTVKAETLLFLCRCFQQCLPSMVPKTLLKTLCPVIVQKLDDTNSAVREAGMECMGTLMRVVGDRPLNSYVEKVEKSKMTLIQGHREAVELKIQTGVIPSPMKGQAARPSTPSVPTTAPPEKEEPSKKKKKVATGGKKKKIQSSSSTASVPPEEAGGSAAPTSTETAEPAKKSAKEASSTTKKKPAAATGGSKGGGGKGKGKAKGGAAVGSRDVPDPPEPSISTEELEDKGAALFTAGLMEQLVDTKWKERLEACDKLKLFVEGQSPGDMQSLLCIKVMGRKPGWKDSNFQVMNAKLVVVSLLAKNAKVFGKKSTACMVPTLVDKLGDIKVKTTSSETLMVISECMTLNYVALQGIKYAFEQKNPKVQSGSLEWLSQAIREFGFLLDIKPFIDFIKKAFGATNAAVRTAAISLLGVIHLYIGAQLRVFFEEEKPAILQQIDAAFEKMASESAPAPTRGPNVRGDEEEEQEEEEGGGGGGGGGGPAAKPVSMADLMPKVDISGQIKSELIKELGDKNWKIRGEGLQKVVDILKTAKFIEPQLGDLPGALKARLGDSNKNLVITTLNIVSTLASAMGSNCSRFGKLLLPHVIATFTDSKVQVRAAGVSCLNSWHAELGVVVMVEQETLTNSLATENPNLRAELLNWLEEKLPSAGKLPSEFSTIVPPLFSCMEDRSGDVRKKAQVVLPHVMAHVGYDNMCKQCSKLSSSSRQAIKPLLDKVKPARPPPSVAAPAKPPSSATEEAPKKSGSKGKASKVEEVVEEEPEKPATSSQKKSAGTKKGGAKGASSKTKGGKKVGGGGGEDSGAPLIFVNNGKETRIRDEEKMKTIKWNFNQPRKEHIELLKDQLQPCVSSTIFTQLFHDDFKKHIAALDTLTKCISNPDSNLKQAAIGNVDLLLRWVTIHFFDTNTTVNLKCLDFLKALFQLLVSEENYRMTDYEANAFLPYLVTKVGDSKEQVRKGVRALFREICSVYAPAKLFMVVMDGLKSKNARQRAECLEELGILIQNNGMLVCGTQPQKTVPTLAAQISDRDNTVRSAALNTMVVVYNNMGEGVYKYTTHLSDKDVSLLEERIKRSGKKFPAATAASVSSSSSEKSVEPSLTTQPSTNSKKQGGGLKLKLISTADSKNVEGPPVSADSDPAVQAPQTEKSVEPEAPLVPPSAERLRPGSVPGPFKLGFDFEKMYAQISVRNVGGRDMKYKVNLSKEDLALLEEPLMEMPHLYSKHLNPSFPVDLSPSRMASTSSAINYIISQIGSGDHSTCHKAIRQIEATMVNPSQRAAVNSHVDQLIGTVLMQLRMNFSAPVNNDQDALQQVMELCRRLISCLFVLFGETSLATLASRDSLLEVERDIMNYLVDDHFMTLGDFPQFIRSLNCLMQRVCANSDKTSVFGSLIHLLLTSLGSDGSSTKLTEFTMKCLWKLTKQIPHILPLINLDKLLLEIHLFMQSYLDAWPSPSHNDMPFRTVKTILYHITNSEGIKLLDHVSLIKEFSGSKVMVYIHRTLAKKRLSAEQVSKTPSTASLASDNRESMSTLDKVTTLLSNLPSGSSAVLSDIFNKISGPDTSVEAMTRLNLFLLDHPNLNLDDILASQTQFYRDYINRGLRMVRDEASFVTLSKCDYDVQLKLLEEMKQRSSKILRINMEEIDAGGSYGIKRKDSDKDENRPSNKALQQPTSATNTSIPNITSSIKALSGNNPNRKGATSSVDLADLRRRLDKLKGTG